MDNTEAKAPETIIEMNNHLASLSDVDRAEVFYDLAINGFQEVEDDDRGASFVDRTLVLAAIAGWTMERAAKALYNFETRLMSSEAAKILEQKEKGASEEVVAPTSGTKFVD